ncbi:hypothetical protein JAAARDRAFT_642804 [Jaapia argillacea MUCL 33604]|uniref:Secreted protein n=1 Tax=Jaapia argillacea MUCL 33604 TaxID=933084 RepID=A0A067PGD5_9AGAM|nr:hypothetical protein JAAARDRAFT_642804 [Jaapia argillacea MUCL 33604]
MDCAPSMSLWRLLFPWLIQSFPWNTPGQVQQVMGFASVDGDALHAQLASGRSYLWRLLLSPLKVLTTSRRLRICSHPSLSPCYPLISPMFSLGGPTSAANGLCATSSILSVIPGAGIFLSPPPSFFSSSFRGLESQLLNLPPFLVIYRGGNETRSFHSAFGP